MLIIPRPDLIPGGRASRRVLRVDPWQLEQGIRIELEHTSDPRIAREIALDHLSELPDYYTRLLAMERAAGLGSAGVQALVLPALTLAGIALGLWIAITEWRGFASK